ncbi:hypothetical protein [Oceanibium sediminis]|uniref:hypothetical protein n=1 Tax=Oceanibium sediminis TaxID=2026339 RepID=UPI000DD48BAE|nr:hypothetical protein [Oceanibium sediminis]
MRRFHTVIPFLFVLSACGATMPLSTNEPATFTPVIWKENTPVATRAADQQACYLAAVGAGPFTTQEELAELVALADQDVNRKKAFVDRCMSNKGYTVTEGRVCTARDRARGRLVQGSATDNLPPLSSVSCFDPQAGGFVVT